MTNLVSPATFSSQNSADLWQWQSWNGLPYLTCRLLQDWQHGFFTQQFWSRTPEELIKVLQPEAEAYRVKQVHGKQVLTPSEITAAHAEIPEADGIITQEAQQSAWVASADCTPVLVGDLQTGKTAAVHAGWRGTALGIVPEVIEKFLDAGSSLANLRVALGPAIAGKVYQVSETVAAEIGRSIIASQPAETTEKILATLRSLAHSPLLEDPQPGRVRIDVRQVNVLQLQQLGIDDEQIAIAPYCTFSQPDFFFSYRRSKQKKVQWSGIVSN